MQLNPLRTNRSAASTELELPPTPLTSAFSHLKQLVESLLAIKTKPFVLGLASVCLLASHGFAQAPAKPAPNAPKMDEQTAALNGLYTKSMEAFGKADFKTCIDGLREMLSKGAEGPGKESLYFTIAASHFNLKEYKEAKAAFEDYLKNFPSGSKIIEAQTAVGQCQVSLGDKQGALKTFTEIAQRPGTNKERMLLVQANLLKETKNSTKAIELLRPAVTGILVSDESVQIAALLASLEVSAGNVENAFKLLNLLYQRFDVIDNPLQVNALAFEVGDALSAKKEYRDALRAYSLVRRKEDVLALQRLKLQSLVNRYDANLATIRQQPEKLSQLQAANVQLKEDFEEGKKVMEEVEKAEDYLVPLRFRQARAYDELKRPWGSIVLFESIINGKVDAKFREDALFSICNSHAILSNTKELIAAADRYLKAFPNGKYAAAANHMKAVQLLQSNDLQGAETMFGTIIKSNTAGDKLELTLFLLGNVRFSLSNWEGAKESYTEYAKKFPKGEYIEEVTYRSALSSFFKGDYQVSLDAFKAYVKEKPDGTFAPDAGYRIAACYQVAERPAEVVKLCKEWEKSWGYHPLMPEVLSLKGDALATLEKREEAAAAYEKGLKLKASNDVLNYLLFEANKQYQKLGQWNKTADLFQDFINRYPEHPAVVGSMFWLAKAMNRDGRPDEAKKFLAGKINEFINLRDSDSVEQLLAQLAQMCSRKPRPAPVAAGTPPASAANTQNPPANTPTAAPTTETAAAPPAPLPVPPPYDPFAELEKYLSLKKPDLTPLAKARICFANAELSRLTRKPKEAGEWLDRICTEFPAKTLGAALLAQSGDRMLEKNDFPKAESFFKELMESFPKSELIDFAYNGMGQMAFRKGKYEEALKWFNDAVDKVGADAKLKDVTLGKAKALLLLKKLDEAKPLFEQVGATREWKGESTAEALYYLGEIAFEKQDFATGAQQFQRITMAYQRYPAMVAKAYLRSADCFEKLGDAEKAKAQLSEFVSKEKLAALPEMETARKRLGGIQ